MIATAHMRKMDIANFIKVGVDYSMDANYNNHWIICILYIKKFIHIYIYIYIVYTAHENIYENIIMCNEKEDN